MIQSNIIIPGYEDHTAIDRLIRSQYEIWRQGRVAQEEKFVIENVHFSHDPDWRCRVMSIQAAHDGRGIWKAGHVLSYGVALTGAMGPFGWMLALL